MAPLSSIFTGSFAPLFESLHSIMLRLINANVMKLSPINPIDTSKPLPTTFDPKAFCQYHRQARHDTEKYYQLKHAIQDLVDSNTITVEGVNDKGNKSVSPPNQNVQIFTNPLPSHSANVVEPKCSNTIVPIEMCVEANNVVNLIEQA